MTQGVAKDFEQQVADEAEVTLELYREAFKSYAPPTSGTRGDREFMLWFLMNLGQYGPDWARALEFVEGGKDLLRRFTRLTQGVGNGTPV